MNPSLARIYTIPMIALVPILVAIIGVVIYTVSGNPKVAEIGRIAYGCGLLVFLLSAIHQTVSIMR